MLYFQTFLRRTLYPVFVVEQLAVEGGPSPPPWKASQHRGLSNIAALYDCSAPLTASEVRPAFVPGLET